VAHQSAVQRGNWQQLINQLHREEIGSGSAINCILQQLINLLHRDEFGSGSSINCTERKCAIAYQKVHREEIEAVVCSYPMAAAFQTFA